MLVLYDYKVLPGTQYKMDLVTEESRFVVPKKLRK